MIYYGDYSFVGIWCDNITQYGSTLQWVVQHYRYFQGIQLMLVVCLSQSIEIFHVSSFVFYSVFLCQLHAHTCPLYNVWLDVNMMMFVGSQSFISLPGFMLVSASVCDIRESKQNKEKILLFPI